MLQVDISHSIIIDGRDTGLKIHQGQDKTIIYTPESAGLGRHTKFVKKEVGRNEAGIMQFEEVAVEVIDAGQHYREHKMPFNRYSAAHDAPAKPGQTYDPQVSAGRGQLEIDIQKLLSRL